MGGAFSAAPKKKKAAPPQVTEIDRAVLDLKNARDRLQRYRQKLEQDDAKLLQQARIARDAGKQERALGLLRLRKYKQSQASACENQLLTVLQMVETIGSKQNDAAVLTALAAGKDSLKKMHEETTVDDVLELMDAIREENEVEQEISQILAGVPTLSPGDEEAVEAELEALAADMNAEINKEDKLQLPDVPTGKLPVVVQQQTTTPAKVAAKPVQERVAVPG